MKLTGLLPFLGLLVAQQATATTSTFDVTFDVQDVSQELEVEQIAPLSFPTIFIDESIEQGDFCATHSASHSDLCRDTTIESGSRKSGVYRVSGTKQTTITTTISNFDSVVNGFKVHPNFLSGGTTKTETIGEAGYIDFTIAGWLEFADANQFKAEQTTLSFDITAAYN